MEHDAGGINPKSTAEAERNKDFRFDALLYNTYMFVYCEILLRRCVG